MKRKPIVAFITLLLVWALLAEGSVQGMLVCIHENANHKGDVVHFHLGGLFQGPHRPCEQSQFQTCDAHRETCCRHILLRMDSLNNLTAGSDATFNKTVLTCAFESVPQAPAVMPCANGSSSYPPFPSKDTAFRKTTVLII